MNENPSILVVDDELLIRDLLYDFFSGQGWQVSIADSAEKALDILSAREIDVLLTDIKMPNMDGLALSSQVRDEYPELPVVLMTGYPSVDTAVSALRQRVTDYVIKPFNINQLYKLVAGAVKENAASQENREKG